MVNDNYEEVVDGGEASNGDNNSSYCGATEDTDKKLIGRVQVGDDGDG